jgi:hypothetical protein
MKNLSFETKKNIKNIAIVTALFGTLSFYGFNCAPPSFSTSDDGSQSFVTGSGFVPVDEVTPGGSLDQKTDLPYALMTIEQIFASMINLTNQPNFSNAIMNEFNLRSGSFSVTPDLKFVNGPMLIAITSLAGEVCNGFITGEQAIAFNAGSNARRVFNLVDFAQAPAAGLTQNSLNDVVGKLANAFWGRAPSSDELTLYTGFRTDFVAAVAVQNAAQTRALALATCTSILSSMDSFSY